MLDIFVAETPTVATHRQTNVVSARLIADTRVLSPECLDGMATLDANGHFFLFVWPIEGSCDQEPEYRVWSFKYNVYTYCCRLLCREWTCLVMLTRWNTWEEALSWL